PPITYRNPCAARGGALRIVPSRDRGFANRTAAISAVGRSDGGEGNGGLRLRRRREGRARGSRCPESNFGGRQLPESRSAHLDAVAFALFCRQGESFFSTCIRPSRSAFTMTSTASLPNCVPALS